MKFQSGKIYVFRKEPSRLFPPVEAHLVGDINLDDPGVMDPYLHPAEAEGADTGPHQFQP